MLPPKPFIVLIFCILLLSARNVYSEDRAAGEYIFSPRPGAEDTGRICGVPADEDSQTGRKTLYFPPGNLYPPYAADPFRVGFGIEPVRVTKLGIENTSSDRLNLRAGGQLALIRSLSIDDPDVGWEVSLVGGFNDQNDVSNSLDNIGWDGHYGILGSMGTGHGLAFKFGLLHVSSHVGDEFMQKTGRLRIGYTRQEVAAGVSWYFSEHWRVYAETGSAISVGNKELQKPWRTQLGLEYESAPILWKRRISWYAAADSQSMQERDWRLDVAVQTGLVVRSGGRTWRLGVQWYNGRPPIGEFFEATERYLSFGLWIDI